MSSEVSSTKRVTVRKELDWSYVFIPVFLFNCSAGGKGREVQSQLCSFCCNLLHQLLSGELCACVLKLSLRLMSKQSRNFLPECPTANVCLFVFAGIFPFHFLSSLAASKICFTFSPTCSIHIPVYSRD